MQEEIKEILDDLLFTTTLPNVLVKLSEEKLNQLKDYITNLQEENEKLNNIIDELEKYLNEQIQKSWEIEEQCYETILDKLNELKGEII